MSQSRESLLETFNSFDKDNSGYLDTDEVVQAAQQLGVEATKEEIQAVIFLLLQNLKRIGFQGHR